MELKEVLRLGKEFDCCELEAHGYKIKFNQPVKPAITTQMNRKAELVNQLNSLIPGAEPSSISDEEKYLFHSSTPDMTQAEEDAMADLNFPTTSVIEKTKTKKPRKIKANNG